VHSQVMAQQTACHTSARFCHTSTWCSIGLQSSNVIDWPAMDVLPYCLTVTNVGKLFYHIISTEAALPSCTQEHYQQLKAGLRLTLTALADKLAAMPPAKIQKLKTRIEVMQQMRNIEKIQQMQNVPSMQQLQDVQQLQLPKQQSKLSMPRKRQRADGADAVIIISLTAAGNNHPQQASLVQQQHGQITSATLAAGSLAAACGSSSGSNDVASAAAAAAGSGSRRRWPSDVLWVLYHYCLFHTEWHSVKSPPYNGQLLEQVCLELFGFRSIRAASCR